MHNNKVDLPHQQERKCFPTHLEMRHGKEWIARLSLLLHDLLCTSNVKLLTTAVVGHCQRPILCWRWWYNFYIDRLAKRTKMATILRNSLLLIKEPSRHLDTWCPKHEHPPSSIVKHVKIQPRALSDHLASGHQQLDQSSPLHLIHPFSVVTVSWWICSV